jgi:UDP-N-acetyl-D-mannosaminuronate dehydrogenase
MQDRGIFFNVKKTWEIINMVQGALQNTTICVVGLGYVRYPLTDAFSRHLKTIGYDLDAAKIARINAESRSKVFATMDTSLTSGLLATAVPGLNRMPVSMV